MTLVLIGPPASGKSRVGKRVAKALGCSFIDTDKVVVSQHGPIPDIFREHGEARFREWEREAVADALLSDGVVSLGGGAVMNESTQRELQSKRVVLLTIEPEAVAERIDNAKRPLLDGLESWKRIVSARMPVYEALADVSFDTSHTPVDAVVAQVEQWVRKLEVSEERLDENVT